MRVRSLLRIRHLSDELRKNYDVIRTQRDALLAGSASALELGTLIVHDLKNPLSSILSNVEYLAISDQIPERERESLADVLRASRSMFRMVMNLLDISRSEDGALVPRCAEFDVTALLNEVSSETVRRLEEKGQTLSLDGRSRGRRDPRRPRPGAPRVREPASTTRTSTARATGRISIEVTVGAFPLAPNGQSDGGAGETAPMIDLRIRDEGTGIPEAYRTRIFEKYVRVEDWTSTSRATARGWAWSSAARPSRPTAAASGSRQNQSEGELLLRAAAARRPDSGAPASPDEAAVSPAGRGRVGGVSELAIGVDSAW